MVVLFQASGLSYRAVREWLPIAEELISNGYDPVFIVDNVCPQEWLDRCKQVGARYRLLDEIGSKRPPALFLGKRRKFNNIVHFLKEKGKHYLPSFTPWIVSWLYLRRMIKISTNVITEEQPHAIIVHADVVLGLNTALIKLANDAKIPSLVVPLAIAPPKVALELRRQIASFVGELSLEPVFNKFVARVFPDWVQNYDGEPMFYHPIHFNFAAWWLHVLPRFPQNIAGGFATKVAASSDRAKQALLTIGVVSGKEIVVVGRPEYDGLYRYRERGPDLRSEICAGLGIDGGKKILLYALAHFAEHKIWTWERHWRETEFLLETLNTLENVQVVISLPAACRFEDYVGLARKYNAVVSRDRGITELIPICDVFFAGTSSTTVVLAIGCEKPAVVAEFYGFEYSSSYEFGGGTVVVREREELLPLLQRLMTDEKFYVSLANGQKEVAREWILLDGQCSRRIAREIISLVESRGDLGAEVRGAVKVE